MIDGRDLVRIKERFADYVSSFYTGVEAYDSAIRIKEIHTENVARVILDIAGSAGLEGADLALAGVMATLHDIGRFEQFAKYRTYMDAKSENHAVMGVRAIGRCGIIDDLCPEDRDLIVAVVENHNRATLPAEGEERFLLFLKLLRDADKIDIWRVVTGHYGGVSTHDAVELGLPDTPDVSDAIVQSLLRGEIALVEDMKTLNDFKLLQIGWVFDLNFPRTFKIVRERRYLEIIGDAISKTETVSQAVSAALRYLEKHRFDERSCNRCRTP